MARQIIAQHGQVLRLGRVGENNATTVLFPLKDIIKTWGQGEPKLIVEMPNRHLYPVTDIEANNSFATWTLSASDLAMAGKGSVEFQWCDEDENILAKPCVFQTVIEPAKGTPGNIPNAEQTWLNKLEASVLEATQAAIGSQESAKTYAESAEELFNKASNAASAAFNSAKLAQDYKEEAETAANNAVMAKQWAITAIDNATTNAVIDIQNAKNGAIEQIENNIIPLYNDRLATIDQALEQIQGSKMEFYEVGYSNQQIIKDNVVQTYAMLKEKFDDPKYWLYLHYSGVNYLPFGTSDNSDLLQFNAEFDVNNQIRYESISINGEDVVTINFKTFENTSNKASSVNSRNQASETVYPSMKAMTTYATSKEEFETAKNELSESKLNNPTGEPSVGKVLKVKQVNEDGTFICEWADEANGGGGGALFIDASGDSYIPSTDYLILKDADGNNLTFDALKEHISNHGLFAIRTVTNNYYMPFEVWHAQMEQGIVHLFTIERTNANAIKCVEYEILKADTQGYEGLAVLNDE